MTRDTLTYTGARDGNADCPWADAMPDHPARYAPSRGLVNAIGVALTLDKPLLITGEPGTGKTQLAFHLAWALGFNAPLKFEATSSMAAKDLFYTFDALGRFNAAQDAQASADASTFVTFQALGEAMLRSLESGTELPAALGSTARELCSGERTLVLIDEIDKAPRDVPNDLLNQVEHMYFRVAECAGAEIHGDPSRRPVLVFTSNSERFLPDAFLRRCIFYDIPYPSTEQIETIVQRHLQLAEDKVPRLVSECISLIDFLRSEEAGLTRKPGPAELLDWLNVLVRRGNDVEQVLEDDEEMVIATACTLVKNRDDQALVADLIEQWRRQQPPTTLSPYGSATADPSADPNANRGDAAADASPGPGRG